MDLPVKASREMAMAIIEQLPRKEFLKVAVDVRQSAGKRAFASLKGLRSAARKSGLKRQVLEKATREARAANRRKKAPRSA